MSASDAFENDLIRLIFHGTPIANLADNAAVAPITTLYLSLHTADPGDAGDQTTNEATYGSYGRAPLARSSVGWTVTGPRVQPATAVLFPASTGGPTPTITHFAVGTAVGGAGKLLISGTVLPPIVVSAGVVPQLTTATTLTVD